MPFNLSTTVCSLIEWVFGGYVVWCYCIFGRELIYQYSALIPLHTFGKCSFEDTMSHTLYNLPVLSACQYFLNYQEHTCLTMMSKLCWRFECSGVWFCVTGWSAPSILKAESFKASEPTYTVTVSHHRKPSAHSSAKLTPKSSLVDQ